MKDRIQLIIDNEDLTASKMADIMQVQRSSISHILAGRNKPSMDFLNKLMYSFPNISGHWLLTGMGDMYIDGSVPTVTELKDASHQEIQFDDENELQEKSVPKSSPTNIPPITPSKVSRTIKKIIVIYDDFTSEEIFNA